MKDKPKIGQILFSLNVGNAARRGEPQSLTPVTVVSVGRKYFECKEDGYNFTRKYHLENWRHASESSPTSKLYLTEEEWENEKLQSELSYKIYSSFEYGRSKFTLEQLKQVDSILFPDSEARHGQNI